MAVKKLAKSKRSNKKRIAKKSIPSSLNSNNKHEDEQERDPEDMLDMVDEEDIIFLKNAIANRSYNLLNRVKYSGPKTKKRKLDPNESQLEDDYEDQIEDNVTTKTLLPIKIKNKIVIREVVEDIEVSDEDKEIEEENDIHEVESEDEYSYEDNGIDVTKPISATQLLVARNEVLRLKKIHIGTLSSGLLENPEEKVTNLRSLLELMDDRTPEVYFTVRKLVIASLLEVFKDILPSYEIKNVKNSDVKLKKDTLKLQRYEESLVQYYRKFLQKLEKYCMMFIKKKGDTRKRTEEELKLALLCVQGICDLLVVHPYFNFSQNIAQAIVPLLNNPNKNVRDIVKNAVKTIFKEDKKEEVTLKILRIVNSYLKTHTYTVNADMLEVLLILNLRDVNLDQEKEQNIKQKKLTAKKHNVLQMSKKERKRKKKLQELEKEMLEVKAEENKQTKHKNLTEITKIVFNIYFRILKSSSNTKILSVCLEGLAKFAHCINLEYYIDIVNVLDGLLKEEWLGYKEQLHCIQTIFIMLSGQGEAVNLDPTRFYNTLYKHFLTANAVTKEDVFAVVLKTLNDALIKRRKKVTNKRLLGFVKRLATLSMQVLHNEALGCLGLIKTMMQFNRSLDILLDLDSSVGDGKFHAELEDPEYANAAGSALFEMILLTRHYHPVVRKYARHIASGVPATGDGCLPAEFGKMNAEQLFVDYSISEMSFNPAVPVPKKVHPKQGKKYHQFADITFEEECRGVLKSRPTQKNSFWINL